MKRGTTRHSARERSLLYREGRKGRVAELAETPLMGIRDERNGAWAQHPVGVAGDGQSGIDLLVPYEEPGPDELVMQARPDQDVIVVPVPGVHLAVQASFFGKHESVRIAEGTAVLSVIHLHPWVRLLPGHFFSRSSC